MRNATWRERERERGLRWLRIHWKEFPLEDRNFICLINYILIWNLVFFANLLTHLFRNTILSLVFQTRKKHQRIFSFDMVENFHWKETIKTKWNESRRLAKARAVVYPFWTIRSTKKKTRKSCERKKID